MTKKNLDIIVTEDDPDDRMLIADALRENNWPGAITFVEDGELLLDELKRRKEYKKLPALIFLDLNMPRMDGRQALNYIKSDNEIKHIPVIVMTTSSSMDDVLYSYKAGSNTFFTKPSNYPELSAIIRSVKTYWSKKSIKLI